MSANTTKWEYAMVIDDKVYYSNPIRRMASITDFMTAMHQLGDQGFELVSAHTLTNIASIGSSWQALMTSRGASKQKVTSTNTDILWFKRPMS